KMIDRLHPLRILPIVMFILVSELSQKVNSEITHQWVRINHFLTSKTVEVDSDLKIPCSVEGYPIPIVDWYKDGYILITCMLLDPPINHSKKEGREIKRADELKGSNTSYLSD
ncbi:hypothetical protein ACI65C_007654, partial [Semiaphis heraclei]